MTQTFAAVIEAWAHETEGLVEAIFKQAAQRVAEEMKDPANMPVRTGHLRRSLMASTSAMPLIDPKNGAPKVGAVSDDNSAIQMTIAGAELGDTIYLGFTASYASHVNYGARGRTPRLFVEKAAQKWPAIVASVQAEVAPR